MPISKELMTAILSMDAYNQGYNAGLDHQQTAIGTATRGQISTSGQSSGFFAAAYSWNGKTIISYRGTSTETLGATGMDVVTGWLTGAGVGFIQSSLASNFYTSVTGKTLSQGAATNTILTGHSLGGGLAGYVSALTGTEAIGFDHMPFGLAAKLDHSTGSPNFSNFTGISTTGEVLQFLRNGNIPLAAGLLSLLTGNPVLAGLGLTLGTAIPYFEALNKSQTALDSYGGIRNPIDLHSMALLTMLQYAKDENEKGTLGTDWQAVGKALWDASFNSSIAKLAGSELVSDLALDAAKLQNALAYSVIDEGTRVFGDVGVRAMFNDANDPFAPSTLAHRQLLFPVEPE